MRRIQHTEQRLAYSAGFMDGEAYAFAKYRKDESVAVGIEVSSITPAPLYFLQAMFGGTVKEEVRENRSPNHRKAFRWRVFGLGARACAKAVLSTGQVRVKRLAFEAIVMSGQFPSRSEVMRAAISAANAERDAEYQMNNGGLIGKRT